MLPLYVVVRNDLQVPHQMCQVAHAVAGFASEHIEEFVEWNFGNNTIIVLQVNDEAHLSKLVEGAKDGGFKYTEFYETDASSISRVRHFQNYSVYDDRRGVVYGDGPWLTAVAFAPNWLVQNVLLKGLPLALDSETVKRQLGFGEGYEPIRIEDLRKLQEDAMRLDILKNRSTPKQRRDYFNS